MTHAISIETVKGEKTGRHIVLLEPNASQSALFSNLASVSKTLQSGSITHEWDSAINGFAGNFDEETLEALKGAPGVLAIVVDGFVNATAIAGDVSISGDGDVDGAATTLNEPWGLARISSKARLGCADTQLIHKYDYDSRAGVGVDVYVLGKS
ncbi:hypothetical protein NMY22_g7035 [Coprinellus aureogranulatus]|nr:hypothetical protein NMY22_g7035 [Coprinellus aureogranulatus]